MGKPPTEPEALRREIEQTRAELGETVEALAAKADVKARAQDAVDDVKERARGAVDSVAYQVGKQREKVAELPAPVRAAIAAAVVGLLALVIIRRIRSRRSE